MSGSQSLKDSVVKGFSTKKVQEMYKGMTKRGIWKSEETLVKKYFLKESSILDIGCGSGRTTFELAKMGYKVVGIDLTPAMIKSAKEMSKELKINADFRVGDATNFEFKNESFDNALFSFNGWDQIPGSNNRLKSFKEIFRVMKSGGYFIFTSHIRVFFSKWAPFWIKQFFRMYIMKPIGFKVEEQEWGDRFFRRGKSTDYGTDMYIHISSLSEVKNMIEEAGFVLEFNDYRNTIAPEDSLLKDSVNCMFFVCKKPENAN
ncbi:MAG: class I SAM-dependent methyltransferase [Nanoarchaeota archaeon]|nr:class I SAM-dependent methyltransferase [DPANN group archaeon]MBL7116715.1 class I SAM-dependent methyltransferase [Nanoarchaeota archaeon]